MQKLLDWVRRYMGWIMMVGFGLAVVRPETFGWIKAYSTEILMVILWAGMMQMNISWGQLRAVLTWQFGWLNFVYMVVLPVLAYSALWWVPAELQVAAFLLVGTTAALASGLLAVTYGLRGELAMAFSLTNLLMIPFTLPLLSHWLLGAAVDIDPWGMGRYLLWLVGVPLGVAALWRGVVPKSATQRALPMIANVGLLGVMTFTPVLVAHNAVIVQEKIITLETIWAVGLLGGLTALLYGLGWWLSWGEADERATYGLLFGATNAGMATVIAQDFFAGGTVFALILVQLYWGLSISTYAGWVGRSRTV